MVANLTLVSTPKCELKFKDWKMSHNDLIKETDTIWETISETAKTAEERNVEHYNTPSTDPTNAPNWKEFDKW